ncbi:GDP-mannose 4,6-dehydratase, partial [Enterococcus cecorum]|uniref:GDP-mannose 4,6-dehydratase n=1 Tax=Enterococcus cecorum TaxID=44008 RepID=UPI001AD82A75
MERIDLTNKKILITGGAGFIGSNLILALLKKVEGVQIISIDNMNEYYDLSLKKWRVEQIQLELSNHVDKSVKMIEGDISDRKLIDDIFNEFQPQIVVNLAAQAGVRYSISNPDAYIQSNLIGFE